MTTLADYKDSKQLSLGAVLAEHVEAVQEIAAAICGRCAYRKRQICVDSTRLDREMCPVVRAAREGG